MSNEIELVSDGEGLSVIGAPADVERFLLSEGLDQAPNREIDLHRFWSFLGAGAVAGQVGAEFAAHSGRWVKLTAESAAAVKKFGLMPTTSSKVSHAMIGNRGDIKQWLQIVNTPSMLISGPFAVTALSTMMQQRAMQEQMDEIVEYLQVLDEKVDDILRSQKDTVLADMIGVDLIIEDALTLRNHVGRVSEITWSKVQASDMTLARTQAYAFRQLDTITEKLEKKVDLGDIAKATREAEPRIHEWLRVIARTVFLQDGVSILELDRVLDSAPDDLESHRIGLAAARQNRVALIARITTRLLSQMDGTVQRANGAVLLNPFDSPAAVKASNLVAVGVLDFRERLGLESGHESHRAKRWRIAAGEMRDKALSSASEGMTVAQKIGIKTFDKTSEAFRAVDIDGDGIPDRPRAAVAAENATAALTGGVSTAVAGVIGAMRTRRADKETAGSEASPASAVEPPSDPKISSDGGA